LSAITVGIFYFFGALVPIVPVLFGASNLIISVGIAVLVVVLLSFALAFLSGMRTLRRIAINIAIIAVAVSVTYTIGTLAKELWGISI
jgi:VIT1/CCC1 family predicted Fe2+/Mn2+ transporter